MINQQFNKINRKYQIYLFQLIIIWANAFPNLLALIIIFKFMHYAHLNLTFFTLLSEYIFVENLKNFKLGNIIICTCVWKYPFYPQNVLSLPFSLSRLLYFWRIKDA